VTKFLSKGIVEAIRESVAAKSSGVIQIEHRNGSGTVHSNPDRADFAVAYWGKGATERLGLDKIRKKPVRIICDLWSGACNPNELQKLLDRGFKLRTKDRLHAKVYITS